MFQNKSKEQFVRSSYSIPPTERSLFSILNFKPALANTLLYCIQAKNPILTVTYLIKQICDIQQKQQDDHWSANLTAAPLIHVACPFFHFDISAFHLPLIEAVLAIYAVEIQCNFQIIQKFEDRSKILAWNRTFGTDSYDDLENNPGMIYLA